MDLRIRKTRQSIRDAFLHLREKKSIEKISVTELCEAATINKATFYLHYKSIYELSETLENELIEECFATVSDAEILNPEHVVYEFYKSFSKKSELFRLLFSDSRIESAVRKTDVFLKERIYAAHPEMRDDFAYNVKLTAATYGCFYAYLSYRDENLDDVIVHLASFMKNGIQ